MNKIPVFVLNNGIEIPVIGNGPMIAGYNTKFKRSKGLCDYVFRAYNKFIKKPAIKRDYINAVANSFKIGFNLLDFSVSYGHEDYVAEALKKSGVSRKDMFITARISSHHQREHTIEECLMETLRIFETDYVDCLQFHWPVPECFLDTWMVMEGLYRRGLCKSIGVANCHQHHLEDILRVGTIVPAVNQIEVHPLLTQKPLIDFCKSKGILVEAYTPIARNDERISRQPRMQQLCKKYNKSVPQIVLRWHIQNGIVPIVRSMNPKRQIENLSIFDFEIDREGMEYIDSLNINSRLRFDPDNCDYSIL